MKVTKYNKLVFGVVGAAVGALVAFGVVNEESASNLESSLIMVATTLIGVFFSPKNAE